MAKKQKTSVMLPGGIAGLVRDLQNGGSNAAPKPTVDKQAAAEQAEKEAEDAERAEREGRAEAVPAGEGSREGVAAGENGETRDSREAGDSREARDSRDSRDSREAGEAREARDSRFSRESRESRISSDARQAGGYQAGGYQAGAQGQAEGQGAVAGQDARREVPGQDAGARPGETAAQGGTAPSGRGRRPKENTMREYHIVKDDSKDSWDLFLDMAKQYKDGGGKLATIYIDESLKNVLDRMKYCGSEKLPTSAILSAIVGRFIFDHEDDIRKVLFSGDLF